MGIFRLKKREKKLVRKGRPTFGDDGTGSATFAVYVFY